MNRYPPWKYVMIAVLMLVGVLYAAPNFYGEDPALQISAARGAAIGAAGEDKVVDALEQAGLEPKAIENVEGNLLVRFADTESQLAAADAVGTALGLDYTVAVNLAPATPDWLRRIGARPMYLGLDLRGGVHFLLEVDMDAVKRQAEERFATDIKTLLRDNRIRYQPFNRSESGGMRVRFREAAARDEALALIGSEQPELLAEVPEGTIDGEYALDLSVRQQALEDIRKFSVQQNLTTLRNRVNELGVAEPVIQQQGQSRIVIQLPGVQDTARAKEILGGTATLEFRMVDDEGNLQDAVDGKVPVRSKLYYTRADATGERTPVLLRKEVMLTGDSIIDAASGIEQQSGTPAVFVTLDGQGARKFSRSTRDQIGRPMAVIYIEQKTVSERRGEEIVKTKKVIEEVISVATIRDELGKRFQITGLDSTEEARTLALLLRAGALAAPIEIVEERTVGPTLGQENVDQGLVSVTIAMGLCLAFMAFYYRVFGLAANVALLLNLVFLVAMMSLIQATLTLPGIAGIVLTIGMAVDANVLINERIREELRNGNSPQASIQAGYDRAWTTILDSNVTTLIAGVLLFAVGTGPIKGFAVTLCMGILTSMFTAVVVSRGVINLIYGGRRVTRLSI